MAPYFIALNKAWIQKYFTLEPADLQMFQQPQQDIIEKGGHIFFATYHHEIAGTVALLKLDADRFELSKMAVDEKYQGHKIGHALMQAAIEAAKAAGAKKLVLYSNTLLSPAIHLYKKFGFREVPLEYTEYSRSNIKMEKDLI